jgi:hypothetical protein
MKLVLTNPVSSFQDSKYNKNVKNKNKEDSTTLETARHKLRTQNSKKMDYK